MGGDIPPELWLHVAEFIPDNELRKLMSVNRVFFVTGEGRMGLGPTNTQKGDKICILCGGQVPFLLREEGMCWRLKGDAYLDGVMNVSFYSCEAILE